MSVQNRSKKFKKGDEIIVISGASKGKVGKIISILGQKVTVEKINLRKIHKKPTSSEPGKIINKERPINISNIAHVEDGKPQKVKIESGHGDKKLNKVRIFKKSKKQVG